MFSDICIQIAFEQLNHPSSICHCLIVFLRLSVCLFRCEENTILIPGFIFSSVSIFKQI